MPVWSTTFTTVGRWFGQLFFRGAEGNRREHFGHTNGRRRMMARHFGSSLTGSIVGAPLASEA